MSNLKISVVTVCYNAVKDLERTMLSVLNQTYDNVEYIVIDGGSTDGTVEIIKKYADRLAYWVSEPDKGIYDAMNKGIKVATGEWINFMNAGDELYSTTTLSEIDFNSNMICIYGDAVYFNKNRSWKVEAKNANTISNNMPNTHQSFFIRLDHVRKAMFDLRYKYAADYNMIYGIYTKYGSSKFMKIDLCICKYEAQDGISMIHANDVFGEVIDIRKNNKNVRWYYDYLKYYIKKLKHG